MALSQDADFEYLMADGSSARIDQHGPQAEIQSGRQFKRRIEYQDTWGG